MLNIYIEDNLTNCEKAKTSNMFFLPSTSANTPANKVPKKPPKPNSDTIHDICNSVIGTPSFIGVSSDFRIKILDEDQATETP